MTIKSITVTLLAPMSDHAANRGEKLLGNASSIKRRPDGRVYISGQMQRHALFSAIDRLNADDPEPRRYVRRQRRCAHDRRRNRPPQRPRWLPRPQPRRLLRPPDGSADGYACRRGR